MTDLTPGMLVDVRHTFRRECEEYPHPKGLVTWDPDGDEVTVPEAVTQEHWPPDFRAALLALVEAAGNVALQASPAHPHLLTPGGAELRAALARVSATRPDATPETEETQE